MRGSAGEAEAAVEQAASVQCGESDDTHVASHLQGLPAGEGEATVEAEEEAPVAEAKGRGEGASQDGDESEVEVESTVGKAPPAGSEANPSPLCARVVGQVTTLTYGRAVGQAEPEAGEEEEEEEGDEEEGEDGGEEEEEEEDEGGAPIYQVDKIVEERVEGGGLEYRSGGMSSTRP